MSADLILGIDPGLRGALALVELATGRLVELYDMPVNRLKSKNELDGYKLAHIIDSHAHEIAEAWIEHAWTRPGEMGPSGFAFGEAYGMVKGVVVASFIPLHEVSPQKWKSASQIASGDKDDSRKAASIRWPACADRWPNKGHNGRTDAALIADYGRRQLRVREAA